MGRQGPTATLAIGTFRLLLANAIFLHLPHHQTEMEDDTKGVVTGGSDPHVAKPSPHKSDEGPLSGAESERMADSSGSSTTVVARDLAAEQLTSMLGCQTADLHGCWRPAIRSRLPAAACWHLSRACSRHRRPKGSPSELIYIHDTAQDVDAARMPGLQALESSNAADRAAALSAVFLS
jgi:hypothetical protein